MNDDYQENLVNSEQRVDIQSQHDLEDNEANVTAEAVNVSVDKSIREEEDQISRKSTNEATAEDHQNFGKSRKVEDGDQSPTQDSVNNHDEAPKVQQLLGALTVLRKFCTYYLKYLSFLSFVKIKLGINRSYAPVSMIVLSIFLIMFIIHFSILQLAQLGEKVSVFEYIMPFQDFIKNEYKSASIPPV